jgi:hypothetical protein
VALARNITGISSSRATVNYMWAYFFGRGIVDPPDSTRASGSGQLPPAPDLAAP